MKLLSTVFLACSVALTAACGDDDKTIDTPYAYAPDASPDDGGAGGAAGASGAGVAGAAGGMK